MHVAIIIPTNNHQIFYVHGTVHLFIWRSYK